MSSLTGKFGIVFGVANKRSIAWAIAKAWSGAGAKLAFTYQGERIRENVEELAGTFGSDTLLLPCDVTRDEQIAAVFEAVGQKFGKLHLLLHSVAFAPKEALEGEFVNTSREAFRIAHDVSSYSFAALAKAGLPMMQGRKPALLTLTYLGAVRSIPHYNVMGLAKASLEANVRYLAHNLGPKGIRVNAISAGPIKTLAAAGGIADFGKLLGYHAKHAPMRRNTTIEEVGNAAAFLLSDLASGITGEILYVDGGFNTTALGSSEE